MNILDIILYRVETARESCKEPCKSYTTKAKAEKATAKMAKDAGYYFSKLPKEETESARYFVLYIPSWNRWIGAIDMTELIRRESHAGGYLGFCEGFFSY